MGTGRRPWQVAASWPVRPDAVPWDAGVVAYAVESVPTRFIQRWMLYVAERDAALAGTHAPWDGVLTGGEARVVAAGGTVTTEGVRMPADVGLALPQPGQIVTVLWRFRNATFAPVEDRSALRVCTASGVATNLAAPLWLGTESGFPLPLGQTARSGSCTNSSAQSANVVAVMPFMHELGENAAIALRSPSDGRPCSAPRAPAGKIHAIAWILIPRIDALPFATQYPCDHMDIACQPRPGPLERI